MRIHNSLRNNFFSVVLFSILLLPAITFAKYDVKGDTSGNINNYEGGSYYGQENNARGYNTASDNDPKTANFTLFNTDQTKYQLTPSEITGLKLKLQKGGSKIDLETLTLDNVYTINTGKETIFIYDPKVQSDIDPKKNTEDQKILGVATGGSGKDSRMYIYKNPPLKESKAADDSFSAIDQDRGLEPGTTLARKNKGSNLQQERVEAQVAYDEALKNKKEAQAALDAYTGSDAARRAELENAVRQANIAEQNAGRAAATAGNNLAQYQQQQINSGAPQTTQAQDGCESTTFSPAKPISSFYCITMTISKLTNIGFKLVSFIAYVVGTLFDYSLELSINSAEFFKKLGVIEITWSFIRDILNMTFIFILLWTAIQILIGNEARYNAKKMLTNVIIVAILINFSLFAAKLMVDGSNIVSLKIYEAMKANSSAGNNNASISDRVMNTVGLTSLYNISEIFTTSSIQAEGTCATNPGALITISVMGSIFLIVLCLALGLAAILFLVRLVNIIFLFIKSPLWVWGYVMPGNSYVSKFKDEWMSEMKHVLIFPIAYLFWMLVAVIIFEKLGSVKQVAADGTTTNGVSLLNLICQSPGTTGGFGQSISLVAIFCIVIIFMMKAIEYGVKHATGGSGALGNDIAKKWSGKFDGYQTAMTKGLAKKAGVAARDIPGRVAGGGLGFAKAKFQGDKGWQGFKDGVSNPGIKAKETLRDIARHQVAKGGIAGEYLGITTVAGKVAKRYEEPKNILGETKEKADERRSKGAVTDQNNRNDAINAHYKIEAQKDWEKKNPTGTPSDYKIYIEERMKNRSDAMLGKDVIARVDHRDKGGPGGSSRTHLEIMREEAIKESTDPKTGKISVKFNESSMHDRLKSALEYHSTGEGAALGGKNILKGKKRFETYANVKSKARVKAIEKSSSGYKSKAATKDATKNQIEQLEKTIQEIENLPTETRVDEMIAKGEVHKGLGEKESTVRDLNKAITDHKTLVTSGAPAADISKAQKKIDTSKQKYLDHLNKQPGRLTKEKDNLAKKLKAQEEEAEKAKNK
ncbi:hypothetical protein H7X65_00940 [Candidatus Parcubacteria bacterium]|nr:hypothetical protein [Candidatus Parcubacteria bacterium]